MTHLTATIPRRDVPGPPGIPLLGSVLDLRRDLLATFEDAHRRYGDVVRIFAGPPGLRVVMYVVFSPEGVRQVLTGTGRRYTKGNLFYRETAAMLGDGLLTSEGDRWQRQKRFIQPLFTRHRVACYVDVMAEQTAALIGRWRAAARRGCTVDAGEDMMRLTLAVIGRVLFGDDLDQATPVLREALPVVSAHVLRRGQSPLRVPASWPTPANRRAGRAQRRLYEVVEGIIDRRRASPAGEDLLSLLLRARDPAALSADVLDDAEVRDQVLIFLLAGHETTATALTFTLHLLGRHLDVQTTGARRGRAGARRRRSQTDCRADRRVGLYHPGRQGSDATVPVGLRDGTPDSRGRHHRRLSSATGCRCARKPVGHSPPPTGVGSTAALQPRPLQPRTGKPAPPLRVSTLRWWPTSLHRPIFLHARGDPGHCQHRPRLWPARSTASGAADPRHHPATCRTGAFDAHTSTTASRPPLTPRPSRRIYLIG
jgi:cytochrome P450